MSASKWKKCIKVQQLSAKRNQEQLKEQSLLSTTKAVLSEYHEIGSNKYPNLLGCPRFDWMNIQI